MVYSTRILSYIIFKQWRFHKIKHEGQDGEEKRCDISFFQRGIDENIRINTYAGNQRISIAVR